MSGIVAQSKCQINDQVQLIFFLECWDSSSLRSGKNVRILIRYDIDYDIYVTSE